MARFLCHGVLVLAAVLFSIPVTAATLTPITDPGTGAKIYVPSADGLGQSRGFTATVGVEPSGSVRLPTTIKKTFRWPGVGTAVKTIAKGSPQAIIGTVALGYLLDQVTGSDVEDGSLVRTPDFHLEGEYYAANPSNAPGGYMPRRFADERSACFSLTGSPPTPGQWVLVMEQSTTPGRTNCYRDYSNIYCPTCVNAYMGYSQRQVISCSNGYSLATFSCNETRPQAVPFTDADFDELASHVPDIPAGMWDEFGGALDSVPGTFDYPDSTIFDGPASVSGSPTTTTTTDSEGNTTVIESTPTYNFDFSSNPLSVTSTTTNTTNTYNNGQHTSTTVTTTSPVPSPVVSTPGASETEVPTDCSFMPTVCEFIEWVKTPFEPDEVDFAQFTEDKNFGESVTISGNAICPAPMILNTYLGDFEFSWEPACQWAGLLKPILIIGALLAAIYISLGVARGD